MSLEFIFDSKNQEYSPLANCSLIVFDPVPKVLSHVLPVKHVPFAEVAHYVGPPEVKTLIAANIETVIWRSLLRVDLTRVQHTTVKNTGRCNVDGCIWYSRGVYSSRAELPLAVHLVTAVDAEYDPVIVSPVYPGRATAEVLARSSRRRLSSRRSLSPSSSAK